MFAVVNSNGFEMTRRDSQEEARQYLTGYLVSRGLLGDRSPQGVTFVWDAQCELHKVAEVPAGYPATWSRAWMFSHRSVTFGMFVVELTE
jgi:hypothetical protein